MNKRMTVFKATLVQDSALSVSGLDAGSVTDRPFTMVDGAPILSGRGLKGAAVAMARRFFDPLPRSVSEDPGRTSAYRRSAWQFGNATLDPKEARPRLRASVGIRQKTGARAGGVLHDFEVIPAGTRWLLEFRVDWSLAKAEAEEAEGILGYILGRHWSEGRCWLFGDVARGLGWCHIDSLQAFRLGPADYEQWVTSGRTDLPKATCPTPVVEPTRNWCFRTLDLTVSFGEYRPDAGKPDVEDSAWGVDMLAIGPHDAARTIQPIGDGAWSRPPWALADEPVADALTTERAMVMEGDRPLLPGSSLRGPLRHAFSRATNAAGADPPVKDPHGFQEGVGADDEGGKRFGTVDQSSRILIRDGVAQGEWAAARLQMHAEDEFSAGSYGSAKRDAVRLLRGAFPTRIVVEGPDGTVVDPLVADIDRLVALGELGHLPVGGHKTRGAGWGRWRAAPWTKVDVQKSRCWEPAGEDDRQVPGVRRGPLKIPPRKEVHVCITDGPLNLPELTLAAATDEARDALGADALVAWWCEPAIDLRLKTPPTVFGWTWPPHAEPLQVDEVAFYAKSAAWRAARTAAGTRWVKIMEVTSDTPEAREVTAVMTPARLHNDGTRFRAARTGADHVFLREWHVNDQILGFTLMREPR